MAGSSALCLALVVIFVLTDPAAVSAKGGKHCPRKAAKFDRRIRNCYLPLSARHDPSAPHEYCRDYKRILSCVTGLVHRCKHRHWLPHKMDDMDNRVNRLSRMIDRTC